MDPSQVTFTDNHGKTIASVVIDLCEAFNNDFDMDNITKGNDAALKVLVAEYKTLLDLSVLADSLNSYIEKITTALYSLGYSDDMVSKIVTDNATITPAELNNIFGTEDFLNDDKFNTDFTINNAFGYLAEWHIHILNGREDIRSILGDGTEI